MYKNMFRALFCIQKSKIFVIPEPLSVSCISKLESPAILISDTEKRTLMSPITERGIDKSTDRLGSLTFAQQRQRVTAKSNG